MQIEAKNENWIKIRHKVLGLDMDTNILKHKMYFGIIMVICNT